MKFKTWMPATSAGITDRNLALLYEPVAAEMAKSSVHKVTALVALGGRGPIL
jgi:hypothetical protein